MAEETNDNKGRAMANEAALQESYQRMQLLQQLLESIGQNISSMEDNRSEIELLKQSIEGLGNNTDEETMVLLANGIFLKAKITDFNNFLVGVGRSIMVEKDKPQLIEFLNSKVNEIDDSLNQLRAQYEEIAGEFTSLYRKITGQSDNDEADE